MLLDHEATLRRQKRFESRARAARLRHPASVEDVDYRAARGLDRAPLPQARQLRLDPRTAHLLITGPCGVGKSWLACALGHKACREDLSVPTSASPGCSPPWRSARGDGRYTKMLRGLARVDLLILDDWGPETARRRAAPRPARDRRGPLRPALDHVTSQVPVDRWYEIIGNPTIADAILDRLVHNAYRIELTGESLRKRRAAE